MKDHNPHDPVNMIGEAYELFVERAMQDLHVRDGTDSKNPSKPTHRIIKSSDAPSQKSLWIENKKFLLDQFRYKISLFLELNQIKESE